MKEWLKHMKFEQAITVYILTFMFAYIFYTSSNHFPDRLLNIISDYKMMIVSGFGAIIGYIYGASRSSLKKDDAVSKLIDQNKTITDEKNSNAGRP